MPQIQLGLLHTSTYTSKIIVTNWIRSKHYDKRDDDFNFRIWSICLSVDPIFQSLWFIYRDFLDIAVLLTWKLLNQGFLVVELKSSFRKFYDGHHDMVKRNGIYASQMTMNLFRLSYSQSGPFLMYDILPGLYWG